MGGSNKSENVVKLSAREHFLIHYFLTKFIIGNDYYKMVMAFNALSVFKSGYREETYSNSRLYEANKKILSLANSKRSFDMWKNVDYRKKITKKMKEYWESDRSNEQLDYIRNNSPLKNKETHKKSMETRAKRGSNVFSQNNPMKDKETALKIAAKRAGDNHYLRRKIRYFYKYEGKCEWNEIPKGTLHKFRKESCLSRTDLKKLLETGISIKNVYMKMEETLNEN
jgi:hypothetical protein